MEVDTKCPFCGNYLFYCNDPFSMKQNFLLKKKQKNKKPIMKLYSSKRCKNIQSYLFKIKNKKLKLVKCKSFSRNDFIYLCELCGSVFSSNMDSEFLSNRKLLKRNKALISSRKRI